MIGNKLKNLREENNLSKYRLAQMVEVSQQAIADWENNKSEPKAIYLAKLADIFNVSTDFLLGREDEFGNKINNDNEMYVKVVARSKGNTVKPHYEKLTPEDIKLFEEILEKLKKQ